MHLHILYNRACLTEFETKYFFSHKTMKTCNLLSSIDSDKIYIQRVAVLGRGSLMTIKHLLQVRIL